MGAKKTNCLIHAWREYASGDAVWLAMRLSNYSKLKGRMPIAAKIVGTIILYAAGAIWLVGHYLRFGTWPHFIHCRGIRGDCIEVAPKGDKSARLSPPVLFQAETRRHGDDRCHTD